MNLISTCIAHHVRGKSWRGALSKKIVFGPIKFHGKAYIETLLVFSRTTLQCIIRVHMVGVFKRANGAATAAWWMLVSIIILERIMVKINLLYVTSISMWHSIFLKLC